MKEAHGKNMQARMPAPLVSTQVFVPEAPWKLAGGGTTGTGSTETSQP